MGLRLLAVRVTVIGHPVVLDVMVQYWSLVVVPLVLTLRVYSRPQTIDRDVLLLLLRVQAVNAVCADASIGTIAASSTSHRSGLFLFLFTNAAFGCQIVVFCFILCVLFLFPMVLFQ